MAESVKTNEHTVLRRIDLRKASLDAGLQECEVIRGHAEARERSGIGRRSVGAESRNDSACQGACDLHCGSDARQGLSHLVSTGIWNNASQWEERLLLRKARPLEDVELECGSCFVHCSYNTASIDCRDLRHVDRIKRVDRNELGTNE